MLRIKTSASIVPFHAPAAERKASRSSREEWTCLLELRRALKAWLTHDNEHDRHFALGYQAPQQCERDDLNRHSPPFVAA
jgi:hypothetical protein